MRREVYNQTEHKIEEESQQTNNTAFLKNISLGERWWTYNLSVGKVIAEKKKIEMPKRMDFGTELKLIPGDLSDNDTKMVENTSQQYLNEPSTNGKMDDLFILHQERMEELIGNAKKYSVVFIVVTLLSYLIYSFLGDKIYIP